jgi:hypothetical protein
MSPASARPGCRRSEAVPPPRLDRHSQTPRRVEPIGAGPGWPPPLYLDFLGHFGGVSSGFPRAPKAAHSLAPAGLTRCQISAGRQVRGAVSCNSLICLEKSGLCPRQGPARDLGPMTPRWGEPPPAPGSSQARRGTRNRRWGLGCGWRSLIQVIEGGRSGRGLDGEGFGLARACARFDVVVVNHLEGIEFGLARACARFVPAGRYNRE